MGKERDTALIREMLEQIDETALSYPEPPSRYDPGHIFDLPVTGVCPATEGRARLAVERFVGGGFAGQVYRVRLLELTLNGPAIPGLEEGGVYALKILIPPSRFSVLFRNAVYWLGYQCSFGAQVNPAAARTGVLWQKLIRRGAGLHFGDPRCVTDTYATFFDPGLGSYGEINEWVEGRNWRYEIDEKVFSRGKYTWESAPYSKEYLAKKAFMADFVRLLHDMGAPELARQYEWWTCKSQPNCLKRLDAGEGPADGLTALDFRAGLALLPFLPMSPADFALILRGLARGALVQFDRGSLDTLEAYCRERKDVFEDLLPALEELKELDPAYRAAQPDLTRHALRLVYDGALRRSVKAGLVQGWKVRRLTDEDHARKLRGSFVGFWFFFALGFIPLVGARIRKLSCHSGYRRHFVSFFTNYTYTKRVWRASELRCLVDWYRAGSIDEKKVAFYRNHPAVFWCIRFTLGALPLPATWHRFLTDWRFAWTAAKDTVLYPIRFYRDAAFREAWLTGEVVAGAQEGMLTDAEKDHILERVPDPFIQKYLKCVAVHICTLPVTQVIALLVAAWAYFEFRGVKSWEESLAYSVAILAVFQGLPVSPGSLTRGTYVVYLMIKERNIRNYWLAVLVSYWHYIGYLGFPLQMVKEFPALARFMGGRWATKMVGIIPVFGERGALLEHVVFDMFFNVPLTIRRRFSRQKDSEEVLDTE